MCRLERFYEWAVVCALLGSALLAAPQAGAVALPAGLESGCGFEGCVISYWNPASGGNGHYYAYIPTGDAPLSWDAARDEAAGANLGPNSHGHLATIDSAAENSYIVNSVLPVTGTLGKQVVWLGGWQDDSTPKSLPPDVGWNWITPESWSYTNWASGEPNDETTAHTGDERYLTMWVHFLVNSIDNRGKWNDENLTPQPQAPNDGFIIEYELGVPEPSLALLALLGGALLVGRARRS